MIKKILKLSTGKNATIALVIFILFTIIALPYFARQSLEQTGISKSPDTSFIYGRIDLYRMAELYGEEGRAYYIINRWTFDVVWPLIYGSFIVLGIAYYIGKNHPRLSKMIILPLSAVLFDFLENTGASIVFCRYPTRTPIIDSLTPLFTFGKWLLLGFSFFALAALATEALYRRLKLLNK